jgi:outer membrane protein TolC
MLVLCAVSAVAETRTLTLRQALDLALQQNPDLVIARLDQDRARYQVAIARDPFMPKVFAGSGAAYTTGFPASVDGAAPSIFQTRTQMAIFDQPQRYQIAESRENLRGAEIDVSKQQDEVAFRVASLYLDAEQSARSLQVAQRQTASVARVLEITQAQASEGRVLQIDVRRAALAVQRAKLSIETLSEDLANSELSLAMVLGLAPGDRVHAMAEERASIAAPASEEQSIEAAIAANKDIRRLESNMQAKMLDIKSYKAQRLPKINLIAQYELFAKYYYQNYYPVFQRNSAQFGASFDIPVLAGKSARAYVSQDDADLAKIRVEIARTRSKITADLQHAFAEVKHAEAVRDVALADLELAREQVSVDLAQNEEGRLPTAALEQARAAENEKWLAYYDALHQADRARLNVLHESGTLLTALR